MRVLFLSLLLFFYAGLTAQGDFLWIDDEILDDPEYVSHVSESADGFFWLGNVSGLVRFDGKQTKPIRIKDPESPIKHGTSVSSIMFSDGHGLLWFTTLTAIHSYNPITGRVKTFRILKDGEEIAENYYGILLNKTTGNLWLRAGDGIYSFSPETGSSTLLGSPVAGVSFSHNITSTGEIRVFGSPFVTKGLEFLTVSADESVHQSKILESPLEFIQTTTLSPNHLLAATNRGLQHITIEGETISARLVNPELPTKKCYNTAISSREDHYWVCFPSEGVFEVNLASGAITKRIPNGGEMNMRSPSYLYTDQEKRLWVTDINKGLLVLRDEYSGFRVLPLPNEELISDLYQDEYNDVWAITESGRLFHIDHKTQESKDRTKLLGNVEVFKGRFYHVGLSWFLKGIYTLHKREENGLDWTGVPAPKSIFPGIVKARGRPLRVAGMKIRQFRFLQDSLIDTLAQNIADTNLSFSGIYPLTDSTFLAPELGERLIHYHAQKDGSLLPLRVDTLLATIYAFHKTKRGDVYLGTDNGMYILKDQGPVRILNELGPFYSSVISSIGEDLQGRLWIGSSKGLLCFNPVNGEVRRYSKDDGLPSNQFTTAVPVTLPDGAMYMASTEGLIRFYPEDILSNEPPMESYLSGIWVNQLPLSMDSSVLEMRQLKLKYARNSIDLSLGLIGLRQSGLAGFNYQMIGLEDVPSFVPAGQSIKYPKLSPGNYRFEYTAVGPHGISSEKKSFLIIIVPKFTQTRAFFFLLLAGLLVVLCLIYLLLLRRERGRQQRLLEDQEKILTERERIATELHDDLGGDLASMVFIIDGHQYLQEQGVSSELDISRIGNLANGAIKNMREMIWVLDNSQTTLTALAEQLLSKAREMAGAADLHLQADIAENLPDYSLSSTEKKNILLMGKETMQNIRKHAHASAFTLRFVVEEEASNPSLLIEITDNGRGMAALPAADKKLNHGHGLKNLHNRAAAINGQLAISPSLPSGTKVSFSMPLSPK